ncbi:MAG: cobalamin-binding protein [Gammaproteobacteria bacterium]|nr:cobalamin-binding protein [Gammaproteobacteria bacterium]
MQVLVRANLLSGTIAIVCGIAVQLCASPTVGSTISVVDDSGETIVLEEPAQRIITLAPHLTEQVFTADGGDRIVATVNYSNFPEAASKILNIGSYKKISYEMVVGLNPDLILATGGNGLEMINRLRTLGYTVYVDEPRELEDVASALDRIGKLLGTQDSTELEVQRFNRRLRELKHSYSDAKTMHVFYVVWNEPLITINGKHLISSVMRLCGGENIFSDAIPMAPRINVETVIRRDPDVIIASGHGEQRPDWLDEWLQWPSISAVQHGHLYFIPPDILQRHTVRILDGAEKMCNFIDLARQSS